MEFVPRLTVTLVGLLTKTCRFYATFWAIWFADSQFVVYVNVILVATTNSGSNATATNALVTDWSAIAGVTIVGITEIALAVIWAGANPVLAAIALGLAGVSADFLVILVTTALARVDALSILTGRVANRYTLGRRVFCQLVTPVTLAKIHFYTFAIVTRWVTSWITNW